MALTVAARVLDAVRTPMWRHAVAWSPRLRHAARSRPYRLELLAVVGVLGALVGALVAPTLLFVWGPLLLGVPHLVADVRYLALPAYAGHLVRVADLIVVALLVATLATAAPSVGGLAVLAAIVLAPAPRSRRRFAGVLFAGAALYGAAWLAPLTASYLLLHGHNLVAIGLAAAFAGGRAGRRLVGATALGLAAILTGALDGIVAVLPLHELSGYVLPEAAFAAWSPVVCARLALSFVFLQAVHYAAWLRVVPEAQRARPAPRTFAGSLRALQADFTRPVVLALVVLSSGLVVVGTQDPIGARDAYLRLAGFHAYLELAFIGRCLAAGRGVARRPA